MPVTRLSRLLALLLALLLAPAVARAATCTASITDFNFGTVSLRAGVSNQTQGTATIRCTGGLVDPVGVCLRIGPGGGGAGAGNSPRYMRNGAGEALAYELRPGGASAVNGTFNEVYALVPILLTGNGEISFPIFAQITGNAPSVASGSYSSQFSGAPDITLTYGVVACGLLGSQSVPPGFSVAAQVEASCEIDVGAMAFGVIPSLVTAPIDQTATLNVRCSDRTPYSVTLGQGEGGGTDPARRRMKNGANTLEYGLYRDPARSAVWGTTPATDLDATGAGLNQGFTIYGRIHSGQSAHFGTYTDNVVVTVNY